MVIGVGKGEYFLGSDASSIIEYTDQMVYVNGQNLQGVV